MKTILFIAFLIACALCMDANNRASRHKVMAAELRRLATESINLTERTIEQLRREREAARNAETKRCLSAYDI